MSAADRRVLVVYESLFGNTEQLATAIAGSLREAGHRVELTDVAHAPGLDDLEADLVVLGAPTHAFSLSRPGTRADAVRQGAPSPATDTGVREWLGAARHHRATRAVPTACFDTRVDRTRRLPGSAARKAVRLARDAGLAPVRRTESFYVEDVSGPLLPGELERACTWAADEVRRAPKKE